MVESRQRQWFPCAVHQDGSHTVGTRASSMGVESFNLSMNASLLIKHNSNTQTRLWLFRYFYCQFQPYCFLATIALTAVARIRHAPHDPKSLASIVKQTSSVACKRWIPRDHIRMRAGAMQRILVGDSVQTIVRPAQPQLGLGLLLYCSRRTIAASGCGTGDHCSSAMADRLWPAESGPSRNLS